MPLPVKLMDVVAALEFSNDEMSGYINRETGEVVSVSDDEVSLVDQHDAELPDWQRELVEKAGEVLGNEDFIKVPSQYDIHEYDIMEQFCQSLDNEHHQDALLRAISGRGAFRRFKNVIYEFGIEKDWFSFKLAAFKRIACAFLEAHSIAYLDE